MRQALRIVPLAAMILFVAFAGWRVIGQMQAERHAADAPLRALRWRPADTGALLALAESRMRQGDVDDAEAVARRLLAREPLEGRAFRVLAEAADRRGERAQAMSLYEIAARRAPRDVAARAWLTQRHLERGEYPQALAHIDRILRMAPQRGKSIHPVLVQLAEDPGFAEALAKTLLDAPPWRLALLAALQHPKEGNPVAAGRVMQAMHSLGGLSEREHAIWLDSLIAQGRWGEAYARWAQDATKPGGRLPLVYNGDFGQTPSNAGFDWRTRKVPGVLLRFEQAAGARGPAAYLRFLNRRVPNAGLEQPLMLRPGAFQLRLRVRGLSLRSELGLQWQVVCAGSAGVAGRSAPIDGTFGWQRVDIDLRVPEAGCPGQWLRLVNPVGSGAAQRVVGEMWVDDVTITRKS